MTAIDPRVQRWLDSKNALTAKFLAAVEVQAKRMEESFRAGTLPKTMDRAMSSVIPALRYKNKPYGLSDAGYDAADRIARDYINTLDKPAQNNDFVKGQRCRKSFDDAHNFFETHLHYLTYPKPDNSLDFIAITYGIEGDDQLERPTKDLFQLRGEEIYHSFPRVELSPKHLTTEENDRIVISLMRDWNETGVIVRNVKLQPNAEYNAYYFKMSLGARGRFLTTGAANTKPKLENLMDWRT